MHSRYAHTFSKTLLNTGSLLPILATVAESILHVQPNPVFVVFFLTIFSIILYMIQPFIRTSLLFVKHYKIPLSIITLKKQIIYKIPILLKISFIHINGCYSLSIFPNISPYYSIKQLNSSKILHILKAKYLRQYIC